MTLIGRSFELIHFSRNNVLEVDTDWFAGGWLVCERAMVGLGISDPEGDRVRQLTFYRAYLKTVFIHKTSEWQRK